jgi:hypothetical protein
MQVRMAKRRAGGIASSDLSPNVAAYSAFATSTSSTTDMCTSTEADGRLFGSIADDIDVRAIAD